MALDGNTGGNGMSSVSSTSTTSGNWNTAADWSDGAEPGASSDVTIGVYSSITVTYASGTDSVLSLYTGSKDTLDVIGGSLAVNGNSTLNGAIAQSGGTFQLGGKSSTSLGGIGQGTINAPLTNAGTISVSQGTLVFDGAVTGSGLISACLGTEVSFNATASGGTVSLGAYSDLAVNAVSGFADKSTGFAAGDIIELSNYTHDDRRGGKAFFSEEKKQKTFVLALVPRSGTWPGGLEYARK